MTYLQHALRRPVTLVVLVLGLALGGVMGVQRMAKDIFPPLNVPTIYVAQPFGGMEAGQMEGFLTYYYEYHFLYITGIEHVESRNIQGAAVMKLQFHPGTDMSQAMSETVGYVNRARAMMPPGTPVATVAIGSWDARNAALLAAEILSLKHEDIRRAYEGYREELASG